MENLIFCAEHILQKIASTKKNGLNQISRTVRLIILFIVNVTSTYPLINDSFSLATERPRKWSNKSPSNFLWNPMQNILRKIKKSGKVRQYRRTLLPIFGSILNVSVKSYFCRGDWTLSCVSMQLWDFLNILKENFSRKSQNCMDLKIL